MSVILSKTYLLKIIKYGLFKKKWHNLITAKVTMSKENITRWYLTFRYHWRNSLVFLNLDSIHPLTVQQRRSEPDSKLIYKSYLLFFSSMSSRHWCCHMLQISEVMYLCKVLHSENINCIQIVIRHKLFLVIDITI